MLCNCAELDDKLTGDELDGAEDEPCQKRGREIEEGEGLKEEEDDAEDEDVGKIPKSASRQAPVTNVGTHAVPSSASVVASSSADNGQPSKSEGE